MPCLFRRNSPKEPAERTASREVFDALYLDTLLFGYNETETVEYLGNNLSHLFDGDEALSDFIAAEIKRKANNLHKRKLRFRRKAYLNKWTHFVTVTYDDNKHSEESFRRKLRKCLCNLHTRRGWKYMGVFERAPETRRLHFHGVVYVPDGEMIGTVTELQEYNPQTERMETRFDNSFFTERFGRSDFKDISHIGLSAGGIKYILKYLEKDNERIVYSRGIPTAIGKELDETDFAVPLEDFVLKYVLFDNVIDLETDDARYTPTQMSIWEWLSRRKN